jgi:hypothetical protein
LITDAVWTDLDEDDLWRCQRLAAPSPADGSTGHTFVGDVLALV